MNATSANLNFLKGALDILTGSTTADTGTGMYVRLSRPTAASGALFTLVTGDRNDRFDIQANGTHDWGSGAAVTDVQLYRSGVGALICTGEFEVANRLIIPEGGSAAVAAAKKAAIYCQDNGSGKTQLIVQFASGAAQQLSIEP
jgi:hypothetical protein